MPEILSLPITSDWKGTLRRWGAELRNKVYLSPSDFVGFSDWSPTTLTSYTTAFAAGSLVFANVEVNDATYWVPNGANICFFTLQLTFDISSGTNAYVALELPLDAPDTTYGQGVIAESHFTTSFAERYLVNAIIKNDLMLVGRRPDVSTNQWTTSTDSTIIVSGHYRIEV